MIRDMIRELVRLSTHYRALYCYMILSVWIFLLIAGMYRYIGTTNFQTFLTVKQYNHYLKKEESSKIQKYQQDCSPIESIVRQEDGGILEGWKLQGVLLLTRHGDRGPMSHVKGMSLVDCGHENDPRLNKYKTFLANLTNGATGTGLATNHPTWTKTGPFHSFPLLPAFTKNCMLGQLTYKGVAQLLRVGDIMRQIYGNQLGLLSKPYFQRPINNISQPSFVSDEIIVYSTRYRRTFQSAMALMYSFLPTERWQSLSIRESHSLAFCFLDCACPQADFLNNQMGKDISKQLSKNPTVAASIQWIGTNLLQNPTSKMKAMEVRDAVLSIICHNAAFPCKSSSNINGDMIRQSASTTDPSEIINIDQDDGGGDAEANKLNVRADTSETDSITNGCIESNHVASLLSYTNWQGQREAEHKFTKHQGILRAYGIIRSIVNYMLKMVSGDKTKFVLYSGHDRTIQFLTAALGIKSQNYIIPYAARVIFEVYKSDKETEFYFRLVYNGIDVTREIDFCEGGKSLRVTKDSRGNKADLCPIENIIRYIHDDYFTSLNATNFKDACTIQKKNEF